VAYLQHAVGSGEYPRLAELLSPGPPSAEPHDPADRYADMLAKVLAGVLGPG
jgi:hypothetical protein